MRAANESYALKMNIIVIFTQSESASNVDERNMMISLSSLSSFINGQRNMMISLSSLSSFINLPKEKRYNYKNSQESTTRCKNNRREKVSHNFRVARKLWSLQLTLLGRSEFANFSFGGGNEFMPVTEMLSDAPLQSYCTSEFKKVPR